MPDLNKNVLDLKSVTYDQFDKAVNRYAALQVQKGREAFPHARDPAFLEEFLAETQGLILNEPSLGLGADLISVFDFYYRLGISLRYTLIQLTRLIIREQELERESIHHHTYKSVYKTWIGIPLPIVEYTERYVRGKLVSRIYREGKGYKEIDIEEQELSTSLLVSLLADPTPYNVYRYMIMIYSGRKLHTLYNKARLGDQEHIIAVPSDKAEAIIEETDPLPKKGKRVRGSNPLGWLGDYKPLGELLNELHLKGWITDPNKSMAALKELIDYENFDQVMRPFEDKKTEERRYKNIYTKDYIPSFNRIKPNPDLKKLNKSKNELR